MNIGKQLLLMCLFVIFGCAEMGCKMSTLRVDGVDFPVKVVDIPYQLKYRNEVKGNWDEELRDSDYGKVRPFGMVCGRNASFNQQNELGICVDVDGYEFINCTDVIYRYDVNVSSSAEAYLVKIVNAEPRREITMKAISIEMAKVMDLPCHEEQVVVLCRDGILFLNEDCSRFSFVKRPNAKWTYRETPRGCDVNLRGWMFK